jgi:DNA invertase Pin-like site-specific DNA recombinase
VAVVTTTPAAAWYRVSTGHQEADNQIPDVARFARHHGYKVERSYKISDSAWNAGGPEYNRAVSQALADARRGHFKVLIVWAADRLTRGGAEDLLRLIRQFREQGVAVVSVQEPWLSSTPEIADVLVALAGWNAQQESARRSRRIRAGLELRKAAGLPVGRQPGAKDKKPRKRSGYHLQRERERAER